MKSLLLPICLLVGLALVGVPALPVAAQEEGLSSQEQRLLELVESLERRVAELEKKLGEREDEETAEPPPPPPAALEERVAEIEEQMEEAESPTDMRVYWKEGLRFDSQDEQFKLRIGGRLMNDFAFGSQSSEVDDAVGKFEDGTEFRRARLYISGDIYEDFFFKTQFEFAGGDADLADAYLGMKGIPGVGTVLVGHMKEPFSLEGQTSSRYTTFMERSLTTRFNAGRNTGLKVHNTALNDRMTWAAGVFQNTDSSGAQKADGSIAFTGRVTGLPWYEDDGGRLVHLGLAYSHRDVDDTVRFRKRPGAHLSPRLVDTMEFGADNVQLIGTELAVVYDNWSLQSELLKSSVDATAGGDPDFDSFYVQGSYFLTGEHRRYKKSSGAFDRVRPNRPFSLSGDRGPGAWEIAVRYAHVDLDDDTVRGGQLEDITLGVNWYLNPNMRIMWNYVHGEVDHDLYDGDTDILQTRFQVDF